MNNEKGEKVTHCRSFEIDSQRSDDFYQLKEKQSII